MKVLMLRRQEKKKNLVYIIRKGMHFGHQYHLYLSNRSSFKWERGSDILLMNL